MDYRKVLVSIVHRHIPGCTVYLFGSRARGTHQIGSDIDLALDAQKVLDSGIIGNIKEDIEESTIPYFVDIVDFNNVGSEMKREITKDGIVWSN